MPSPNPYPGARGTIVAIGGAEDKISDKTILSRVVQLSGGVDARIAVVPTASELLDTGDRYRHVFHELGAGKVMVLDLRERTAADDEEMVDVLGAATAVFFTGGNQLRLSTVLGGTRAATLIRRRNAAGMLVAGTSAGAAFISEHMIAFGREGSTPYANQVTLSPGLGLTNRVIVDQHFRQRDRLGRLLTALAYNPFAVGIGLDEDTAAFLGPDNRFEVVGAGGITVVDVSDLTFSSMASAEENRPVELVGIRLHVLANGATFDLDRRVATAGHQRR